MGVGYDIIHEHPNCDGAALGAASYRDFLIFTSTVERLEGGVLLNFGSAIMGPEVYLKALSMARNVARQEGRAIRNFTTAVFDLVPIHGDHRKELPKTDPGYYFRPQKTILVRTVADGGESFYFCGEHRATLPALRRLLVGDDRRNPRRVSQASARWSWATCAWTAGAATIPNWRRNRGRPASRASQWLAAEVTPGAAGTVANNLAALRRGQRGRAGSGRRRWPRLRTASARWPPAASPNGLLVKSPDVPTFTYTKLINSRTGEEDLPRVDYVNTRPLPAPIESRTGGALRAGRAAIYDVILVSDQAETSQGGVVTPALREADHPRCGGAARIRSFGWIRGSAPSIFAA